MMTPLALYDSFSLEAMIRRLLLEVLIDVGEKWVHIRPS
jgi:hypothetical protein